MNILRRTIPCQALNALREGVETTGGIGSLNNQLERPTLKSDDIVQSANII